MKPTRYRVILLLIVIATVAWVLSHDWSGTYANHTIEAIAKLDGEIIDRPAPGFDLQDANNVKHSLAQFRGQVVFLNFWASFCAPCRKEMPSMESLVRQYKSQGFTMVAVSQDQKKEDMIQFMNEFLPNEESAMTVLWDSDGRTAKQYGTSLIPETYLIDRNGQLVARFVNSYDWNTPQAKALIEALLKGEKKQRFF